MNVCFCFLGAGEENGLMYLAWFDQLLIMKC